MIELISVRERPEWTDEAVAFFQRHWASDDSAPVYDDCIRSCIHAAGALPHWYLLVEDGRVIAGAGMIPNDFISRMDLMPWLCALYIEEDCRGRSLGSLLIRRIRKDAGRLGFDNVYLCTDHVGYYEKYGFSHLGTGYHPWGESSRIYCAKSL